MKKVLIITYYWPPAGGPGVQRWLKFVKYLRDFQIEPVVYIPENPDYPMLDESFKDELPTGITILKHPIFEPYKIASVVSKSRTKNISKGIISTEKQSFTEKIMLWIRGNLFIPDARMFWVQPSVKFLSNYLKKENIDTIITTGPPHSLHLIGLQLKKKIGVKWLADFRDPWTTIGYHHKLKLTKRSASIHKKMEEKVLCNADKIIVTSFTTKEAFKKITSKPIEVITNGYDVAYVDKVELDSKFTMSHIGSLLSGRNPEILWEILEELVKENNDFANDFRLQLAGTVSEDVLQNIKMHHLEKHLDLLGYISHGEALKLQRSSQVLLLIEIDSEETRCIIPGKLFEYMAAERPILAIGPSAWDAAKIITETNTGKNFNYTDKIRLKSALMDFYSMFKEKNLKMNPVGLQKYTRKSLTEKLSGVLKMINHNS